MTAALAPIEFELPDELSANEPAEARGLSRDSVNLMVSRSSADEIVHTSFRRLPEFLEPGDLVVVNTSATLNAAFESERIDNAGMRSRAMVHLSAPLSGSEWVIELRHDSPKGPSPLFEAEPGERLELPGGATATLVEPYARRNPVTGGVRLWIARLSLPTDHLRWSGKYGSPIRYSYVRQRWPLSYYQTIFADEPGSAEMPSAGRPFTHSLVRRLERKRVRIAPVTLHTGVSSLDSDEDPYPERYRVSAATARAVNETRSAGGRIVAVGTTVVRALETVASYDGSVQASHGWTDVIITPDRGLHVVDAMLTGFHAPKASHLSMLEALAGHDHLARAYAAALTNQYAWHEFGDVHLILRT